MHSNHSECPLCKQFLGLVPLSLHSLGCFAGGKICLSRGAAFIIPISFIRSSRSLQCRPRSIHYGHSHTRGFKILRRGTTFSSLLVESESFDSGKTTINTTHQAERSFLISICLFNQRNSDL
jgi:hypothetical protein